MKLTTHLFLLALGVLLPMLLFGIAATDLVAEREVELFRSGAMERTLAMSTAVDAQLDGHVAGLKALASSISLEEEDIAGFRERALRTYHTQPAWIAIELATPTGERVMDTGSPVVDLPHISERKSFERVVTTKTPAIGEIWKYQDVFLYPVRVPVLHPDGALHYVLSALVDPLGIKKLLTPERLPRGSVAVVLDGDHTVVARTLNHEGTIGKPASSSLRAALEADARGEGGGGEGWFEGHILEGTEVFTPFHRSSSSGWSVAIGIPRPVVREAVTRTASLLVAGTVIAITVAGLLALLLIRRIAAPIVALAEMARSVPERPPRPPAGAGRVREVEDVSRALVDAAAVMREREKALLAADAAKDEFLAMLGHELRNPLSALTSAKELLDASRPDDEAERAAFAVIGRQIEHMSRLVDDLLDVSRVTRGKVNLVRRPVDASSVVRDAMSDLETAGRFERHQVTLECESVWVDADAARLEQILSNLMANALKFTPKGGRIHVSLRVEREHAVLEVEDEGVGIDADLAPRVFDLFVQDERTLDRSLGGLGIGLTLVKALTERHGGSVTVHSEGHGKGARFTVRLPRIPAQDREAMTPEATAAKGGGSHRILVVEDNEDARRTLVLALTRAGHRVTEAADGLAGLQKVVADSLDAAVIDIGLPEIDGFELARRIRELPDRRRLVLIAVTGYGEDSTRRRALDAGFDEVLRKPVKTETLLESIDTHFAAR